MNEPKVDFTSQDPWRVFRIMAEVVDSFEAIAREWHRQFDPATAPVETKAQLWTVGHAATIMARLERDVFPWLGIRPISEIKAPELLMALRRVQSRGALETAQNSPTVRPLSPISTATASTISWGWRPRTGA